MKNASNLPKPYAKAGLQYVSTRTLIDVALSTEQIYFLTVVMARARREAHTISPRGWNAIDTAMSELIHTVRESISPELADTLESMRCKN